MNEEESNCNGGERGGCKASATDRSSRPESGQCAAKRCVISEPSGGIGHANDAYNERISVATETKYADLSNNFCADCSRIDNDSFFHCNFDVAADGD